MAISKQPPLMPGQKQPPRFHGDGCICGDFSRYDCPAKPKILDPAVERRKTLVVEFTKAALNNTPKDGRQPLEIADTAIRTAIVAVNLLRDRGYIE